MFKYTCKHLQGNYILTFSYMENIFDPEIFDINKNGDIYTVSTKNGKMCLYFTIHSDTIDLHLLEKCNSKGSVLLRLLEEYAINIGIKSIKLQDASEILTSCSDKYGNPISIDLATLKLITKGKSWYNTFGYFSSCNEIENNKVIKLPCIEAIYLSQEEEIKNIRKMYSLEKLHSQKDRLLQRMGKMTPLILKIQEKIDNNETFIRENIERVITKTDNIISDARILFPEVDLTLNVKEYLLNIIPDRFEDVESCEKYKFISEFIKCISKLLQYDCFLTKNISYKPSKLSMRLSRKMRKCKKHCGNLSDTKLSRSRSFISYQGEKLIKR